MSKCAAGYDIPWDGPCVKCGATENENCREVERLEAEARVKKLREGQDRSATMQKLMGREDKRLRSPIHQS